MHRNCFTSACPAVYHIPTHPHSAYRLSGAAGTSAGALQQQQNLFRCIAGDARSGELEAEEVVRRAPVRPRGPQHHAAGEPRARALTPRPLDGVIVRKSLLSDASK